jgi:Protein of unknown function (DUF3703)
LLDIKNFAMKTYWRMPMQLKLSFNKELFESDVFFANNDLENAWKKLERAHIIGQPWAIEHSLSHLKMLIFAFKIKNTKKIIGQLPRLFIGGVKSFVGKIPTGNTGGANVHPLKKMPIPDDILLIMNPFYSNN